MENKIQELADKIYREGVDKANEEAQKIIAKAQEEAKEIIANAHEEAESIVVSSRKSADELADKTKSELRLFARQALNALKSEIANVITDKLVATSVKEVVQNQDFLNSFILTLASNWNIDEPVIISTSNADSLRDYFISHAKSLLDKGITIQQVNGINTLFTIAPLDGSYKINFGEEEFVNYFKAFLRPQLIELLFE